MLEYTADELLRQHRACKKLNKQRNKDARWKLAQAVANDRRLLIGNSRVFKQPGGK